LRVAQWATVAVLIISEAASWSGHIGASYAAAVASLGYLAARRRRNVERLVALLGDVAE
jgi:MYXO-CTERM domain-containing protein